MSLEYYALEWIKPELVETLGTARQGLEAFAESWEAGEERSSTDVEAGIDRCVEALHQVHGSLVMLELDGVRQLAHHLERVAAGLSGAAIQDVPEACQSLMQGILELPGYLDDLLTGGADSLVPLLPIINELRRHLGEPPLEDGSLAGRLQSIASETAIARFQAIDGVDKTRRVRAVYQQVLLSVLKGAELRRAAEALRKVAEGMRRICEQTPFELQWQAFGEFAEALTLDEGTQAPGIDGAVVKLLRRIDSEIREFAQSGSEALRRPLPLALLLQLIDAAHERGRQSPVLDALREAVAVTEKSYRLSMPGRQALVGAAAALREELAAAKDRLDLFVRSDARDPRDLSDLIAPLKQVASTLSLLGFESSKTIVIDQLEVLAALEQAGAVDDAAVHSVAGALVQVDDNLSSVIHGGRGEVERITGEAQRAVAEQARIGLDRVKQCLVDYVSSQWDARHLSGVPEELSGITGALAVIPLTQASGLMQRCRDYIGQELIAGHVPTWEELDRLADAISGIDYYLERLASESPGGADEVLALVERSLDALDLRPAPSPELIEVEPADGSASSPASEPAYASAYQPEPALALSAPPEPAETALLPEADDRADLPAESDEAVALGVPEAPAVPAEIETIVGVEAAEPVERVAVEIVAETIPQAAAETIHQEPVIQADGAGEELAAEPPVLPELAPVLESGAALLPPSPWAPELSEAEPAHDAEPPLESEVAHAPEPLLEPEVTHASEPPLESELAPELEVSFEVSAGAGDLGFDEPAEPEPLTAWLLPHPPPAEAPETAAVAQAGAGDVEDDEDAADRALQLERDPAFDLTTSLFDGMEADALPTDEPAGTETAPTVAAPVPGLADAFDAEEDIVEIFLEEVDDVLTELDSQVGAWDLALHDEAVLGDIRRAFHTLKGSGRLVGAHVLGEMAWAVENMLNRVVDGTVAATPEFVGVVREARQLIPVLRQAFAAKAAPPLDGVGRVIERADMLSSGGSLAEIEDRQVAGQDVDLEGDTAAAEELALFVDEARSYLAALGAGVRGDDFVIDDEAMRSLHTLAGSAAVAGQTTIAELAAPAYELAQALRSGGQVVTLTGELAGFFIEALAALSAMVDAAQAGYPAEEAFQLIAEADRLLVTGPESEPAGAPLLALPSLPLLMNVNEFLDAWRDGAMDLAFADDLRGALAELRAAAEARGHGPVAELAGVLLDAHERYEFAELDDYAHGVLIEAHEQLLVHIDAIAADQAPYQVPDLQAAVDDLAPRHAPAEDLAADDLQLDDEHLLEPLAAEALSFPVESGADPAATEPETVAELPPVSPASPPAAGVAVAQLPEDVDEEILGLFFEEADELLEVLEQGIADWAAAPTNLLPLENLLRALHTLKGGARLAGLSTLGDQVHDLESFLIDFQGGARALPSSLFQQLHERHDGLVALLAASKALVAVGGAATPLAAIPEPVHAPEAEPAAAPATAEPAASGDQTASLDQTPEAAEVPEPAAPDFAFLNVMPLPIAATPAPEARQQPRSPSRSGGEARGEGRTDQEMVRVSAGLLEALVNLAGESSIIRARVEQGMSDIAGSLDEMERTIQRLREQLRRLDIEAEGQMLFRRDGPDGTAYEAFDPLEMDRYSQLQQLSRSLSESASDLLDLKDTLLNKSREAETLLLQQARVNTELQEGLMRSRMVPFSRLLPRLRRTVRQVSRELEKHVELRAFNVDGELDRTLLERMLPPLEHMLRNAVDHGIEAPEQRRAAGKAEEGSIDLRLSREGGDLVIEISDDGAGIDVERVRAKAIERGLLAPDADLKDDQLSQFVLAPGFSTARAVTQISGRGVGMDVVHSEVKQLGGNIDIFTERGRGTRFLLRVPFTVSVNRALMVSVGEDLYAVPLNTIEGIVLVSPEELERLYGPGGHSFEYAGVPYRVQYLGNYLGREYRPQRGRSSVPVVLVRAGEQAVAVHVDGVQGSREIVVKSLGPQFAGVGGISGATILGDGSVVVILDLLALIRAQNGTGLAAAPRHPAAGSQAARRVMVVDDSVTVRKVTSRLLERQGMDVQVAKDGVEAMALLQERRPDVMLLDIEMPRMDGFEVLRQVRHDDRLHDLPVVMISSRTGAKHQQHATELGVNGFLGKPFQESELLSMIDKLMS